MIRVQAISDQVCENGFHPKERGVRVESADIVTYPEQDRRGADEEKR